MKYLVFQAAVLLFYLASPQKADGQSLLISPLEYGESVTPVTAVRIAITVETEHVVPGPYARYAQKYLGAVPPLSPRTASTIKSAVLTVAEYSAGPNSENPGDGVRVIPNVYDPANFVKFQFDRTTAAEMSAENMAREAAGTIFTLRKRRFDLVTGEAGEHVYGAGLQAALEEMARIEEEYVSLFMGKTSVVTTTQVFEVVPEQGKNNYVVCRFSPEEGLLPESDLGASPIVLSITPEGIAAATVTADKKSSNRYRVAAWAECVLMDGVTPLASRKLPLFQFGATVTGK
ncbi:MAG: DUF4831 family protein [Rikenellaceae bacterium]|nr:DUF4831 family protein [Rikenellaceae bacterium]